MRRGVQRSQRNRSGQGYYSGQEVFHLLLGGLFSIVFLAIIYSYTEKGLGQIPAWRKGLYFGVLIWVAMKVPTSSYTWLIYIYPDILNLIETVNGLIGGLAGGIPLAILYEKLV